MRQMTAGVGATGKGNLAHQRVFGERFAHQRATARQDTQQTFGQTGFFKQFGQL